MQIKLGDKDRYAKSDKTALALKAARLIKGLSRKETAAHIGWKPGSFEQIENTDAATFQISEYSES